MTNNRVERKLINGQLCDIYYDKNGEIDLVHWVHRIEGSKWGLKRCPVPKTQNISDQCR